VSPRRLQYAPLSLAGSGEPLDLAEDVFFRFARLGEAISIIHSLQHAFREVR
jgi:hypothetical protein